MERTPQGVKIQGKLLPQQPILSNMTRSDFTFSLLVEEMFNYIKQPEYRQIVVEVLTSITRLYLSDLNFPIVAVHCIYDTAKESRASFQESA